MAPSVGVADGEAPGVLGPDTLKAIRATLPNISNGQPKPKLSKHPDADFPEERTGWGGYIEWEKYPERKRKAAEILEANRHKFDGVRSLTECIAGCN